MAVQAQYPSNAFTPDFHGRPRNNVFEELQLQYSDNQIGNILGAYGHLAGQQILNGTVFSDPESELTCNASGSRKRRRDDLMAPVPQQPNHNHHQISQQLRLANLPKFLEKTAVAPAMSTGRQLSYVENRLHESTRTSTSGRPASVSASPPIVSPLAQDLVAHLHHQNIEVDALIRLQSEKLRLGLEESRKRHCRTLVSVLEQQVLNRLKEKEMELENASRRNAELEEKVKQISAESQIWFNVAKTNEAIVSSLKTSLLQVLLQNTIPPVVQPKEGYGDSEGITFPADDAQSFCFEEEKKTEVVAEKAARENEELRVRKACKVCRENDVSVLLLPCRHLCLCKDCESKLDTCPICQSTKNASLQIFMS